MKMLKKCFGMIDGKEVKNEKHEGEHSA